MSEQDVEQTRSNRREVRNPILALSSVARLMALPRDSREALWQVLLELRSDAHGRAEQCWRAHKAPMAAYWRAVGVYAGHIARVLRHRESADV